MVVVEWGSGGPVVEIGCGNVDNGAIGCDGLREVVGGCGMRVAVMVAVKGGKGWRRAVRAHGLRWCMGCGGARAVAVHMLAR